VKNQQISIAAPLEEPLQKQERNSLPREVTRANRYQNILRYKLKKPKLLVCPPRTVTYEGRSQAAKNRPRIAGRFTRPNNTSKIYPPLEKAQ